MHDLQVNYLGAIRAIQKYLPNLLQQEGASITLFSTVAVQKGMPFHASIAGAKGAVEGLTKSLAAEFAPKIRVNAIAPSLTQTPLADKLLNAEAKIIAAGDRHPLKKIGQAKNITQAVHYLLQNDWVTGQILAVDGGMSTLSNG
jgi:NAD(P)-dependent dehydrogenase (short-subunit alcohol dehydrogenase family)